MNLNYTKTNDPTIPAIVYRGKHSTPVWLHYVLCVGFAEDGRIVVANSSKRATDEGIQLVDEQTIAAAIYENCNPQGMTWGNVNHFYEGCGYVVVG